MFFQVTSEGFVFLVLGVDLIIFLSQTEDVMVTITITIDRLTFHMAPLFFSVIFSSKLLSFFVPRIQDLKDYIVEL